MESSKKNQNAGKLTIRLLEADLTHDTEFFGKMSPFVVFTYKNEKKKSSIVKKGGKKPKWENEEPYEFIVDDCENDELLMEVKD